MREGEPLEIFTDRDGQIILKKYSPMGEMGTFARQYAEALAQSSGYTVCISDKDTIIAASGKGRKELQDKAISPELEQFMQQRQVLLAAKGERSYIPITTETPLYESESHYAHCQRGRRHRQRRYARTGAHAGKR